LNTLFLLTDDNEEDNTTEITTEILVPGGRLTFLERCKCQKRKEKFHWSSVSAKKFAEKILVSNHRKHNTEIKILKDKTP